jgi:hypothetical protein
MPRHPRILIAATAFAATGLTACGGGIESTVLDALNAPTCTTSTGGSGVLPAAVVLGVFATIYQLETGTIDEFGAFIQTSSLIFKLAADGSASVDNNSVAISNTCYQASGNKLALTLGNASSATKGNLELLSGGRAIGTINGKAVRTKPI